jgi:isoamylase
MLIETHCSLRVMFVMISQVSVGLPPAPGGKRWCRVVDTNLPAPRDFTPGGNKGVEAKYGIQPFSSIILIAK